MNKQKLCEINDIDNPGSLGFTVNEAGEALDIMLIRQGDDVFAYKNQCPHTGGPLDWKPGEFLDDDNQYIMCATHAALFKIHNGLCIAGPCRKSSLTPVSLHIEQSSIYYLSEN